MVATHRQVFPANFLSLPPLRIEVIGVVAPKFLQMMHSVNAELN